MKKHFINVNLIDGSMNDMREKVFITVEDELITAIDIMNNFDGEGELIDIKGKYVMPGLIDCHVHIALADKPNTMKAIKEATHTDIVVEMSKNLKNLLHNGVIYIRDVGGVDHLEIPLKKYIADGTIEGPDMHVSGKVVTMTGGHGYVIGREADGVDEVTKAVREQLIAGADLIKVISSGGVLTPGVDVNAYQLNVDELSAAVKEAHKVGKKVATHCHSTQGIKNSILAGVDSIEHCTILDEEGLQMLVDNGTYIVPTLAAIHYLLENGEAAGIPAESMKKAREVAVSHENSFKMAHKAGVKIAMGTDAGTPFNAHGPSSPIELELMVKFGMTTKEAVTASTKTASELIGIEEKYGTLEVGKYANILVMDENPLENISIVQSLDAIYKKGKLVK